MGAVNSFLNAQEKAFNNSVNAARGSSILERDKLQNILLSQEIAARQMQNLALEREQKNIAYRSNLTADHEDKLDQLNADLQAHMQLTDPQQRLNSSTAALNKYFIYSQSGHPTSSMFGNALQLMSRDADAAQKLLTSVEDAQIKRIERFNAALGQAEGEIAGEKTLAQNVDTFTTFEEAAQQAEELRKKVPSATVKIESVGNEFRVASTTVSPLRGADGATSQQVQIGTKDDGTPIFATPGEKTTSVKSNLGNAIVERNRTMRQAADLLRFGFDEIVGFKGKFNEFILDKGLGQIWDGVSDAERIEAKTAYRWFVESNLKPILNDTRLSDADARRGKKILGDPDAFLNSATAAEEAVRYTVRMMAIQNELDKMAEDPSRPSFTDGNLPVRQRAEVLANLIQTKQIPTEVGRILVDEFFPDFNPSQPE